MRRHLAFKSEAHSNLNISVMRLGPSKIAVVVFRANASSASNPSIHSPDFDRFSRVVPICFCSIFASRGGMGPLQSNPYHRDRRRHSRFRTLVLRDNQIPGETTENRCNLMVSKTHAIEILSVLITSIVLGYIGLISGVQLVAVDTPPPGSTHVKVVGHQYYWSFEYAPGSSITYPNGTTKVFPNGTILQNTLYVKAGDVVDLELVSSDVAHSFFIYELGVHIDAIPGHDNHYWLRADTPGTYRIECTQFCGTGHYTMIGQLVVVP